MRQTTILIAEMATNFGIRAPLANIADQVFLELSREIEQHGVSRGVAADMFGMTLRTYQRKVSRLREGATMQEQTLWGAVFEHVRARKSCTRAELLTAFARDDAEEVGAVLNDLVTSGLLYATGRGPGTVFGLTTAEDQQTLARARSEDTLSHLVWLALAEPGGASRAALAERFSVSNQHIDDALASLVRDGRVQQVEGDAQKFVTSRVLIPVGSEAGWESAVFDHFRAVCGALVNKLRARGDASSAGLIGGLTLSFDLYPGHPHEAEVKALLARIRQDVMAVWQRVAELNAASPPPEEGRERIVFYAGQNYLATEPTRG